MTAESGYVKDIVRDLHPYEVEHTEAVIKLDAMENPYPLPEALKDMLVERVKEISINRYPDPNAKKLKEIYSRVVGVKSENLIIGNGSDELIQLILTAAGSPGCRVLYPVPTFSMYGIIARPLNLNCAEVPLNKLSWEIDEEKFVAAVKKELPAVIFISNPNNPTGNCFSESTLLKIVSAATGLVVIDEAYFDFSKTTLLSHIQRHKNLIILRTLSKIGLAGLRIGMMITNERLCAEIGKVRLPYNTSSISQAIAEIVLSRDFEITKQVDRIISDRNLLFRELTLINGITPFTSHTNFILFKSDFPAEDLFKALLSKGILLRHFGGKGALRECLRLTVGTEFENRRVLEELKEVVRPKESEREL